MIEDLATYLEMLAAEEMDQDVDAEVIGQRLRDRVWTDTTRPLDEFHVMRDPGTVRRL